MSPSLDYGRIACSYNELHGQEQLSKAIIVSGLLDVKSTDKVLDVGCGTGLGSSKLKCRLIGVDTCKEMLNKAPIKTILAPAEKLPSRAASFDYSVCITGIHNFRNPAKALDEMRRVTRKLIVVSLLKKSSRFKPLLNLIIRKFNVLKAVDEKQDLILLLK